MLDSALTVVGRRWVGEGPAYTLRARMAAWLLRLRSSDLERSGGEPVLATEPPEILAVIACQRTGSHLLREVLNSCPSIAIWSEPFCYGPHPMLWHNFMRRVKTHNYPPVMPADAAELADEYLRALRRHVRDHSSLYGGPKPELKFIGLDIKYEHIRCLSPLYLDLQARPFLFDFLCSRNARVLHLIRGNIVHNAISIIIANTRKVWENTDGSKISGRFRITPDELLFYVNWIQAARAELTRLTRDMPVQTCVYEDLVDDLAQIDSDGTFPEDSKTLSTVAAFLDVPNRFSYNGRLKKVINRPYAEILENHEDLVCALHDSPYAEFADTL